MIKSFLTFCAFSLFWGPSAFADIKCVNTADAEYGANENTLMEVFANSADATIFRGRIVGIDNCATYNRRSGDMTINVSCMNPQNQQQFLGTFNSQGNFKQSSYVGSVRVTVHCWKE